MGLEPAASGVTGRALVVNMQTRLDGIGDDSGAIPVRGRRSTPRDVLWLAFLGFRRASQISYELAILPAPLRKQNLAFIGRLALGIVILANSEVFERFRCESAFLQP